MKGMGKVINISTKGKTATIDIFGTIGEDWWGEGNTMQSVNDEIKDLDVDNIIVNVGSLGGSVVDGIGIYAILKKHKARVISNIVSPTASAGTIVALGANKGDVNCNEAILFLVHNTSTLAWGNAKELRETADALDKFDGSLVTIYRKKTGMKDEEIKDILAKGEWLSPEEAMKMGFIDNLIEDELQAVAQIFKDIQANKHMPKLPKNYINKFKNSSIMDKVGVQAIIDGIEAKFKPIFEKILGRENEDSLMAEAKKLKNEAIAEAQALLDENEDKDILAQAKEAAKVEKPKTDEPKADETDAVKKMRAQLKEAKGKLETVENENARLKGTETTLNPNGDEDIDNKKKPETFWDSVARELNEGRNRN